MIDVVHLIEVDVIGVQTTQAVLTSLSDVVCRQAAVVRAGTHRLVHLGREDNLVATTALGKPAPDDLLGNAVALLHIRGLRSPVHIGGVDEVDPDLHCLIHDFETRGLVRHHAEVHCAQTEPADLQARASQRCVLHFAFPLFLLLLPSSVRCFDNKCRLFFHCCGSLLLHVFVPAASAALVAWYFVHRK